MEAVTIFQNGNSAQIQTVQGGIILKQVHLTDYMEQTLSLEAGR